MVRRVAVHGRKLLRPRPGCEPVRAEGPQGSIDAHAVPTHAADGGARLKRALATDIVARPLQWSGGDVDRGVVPRLAEDGGGVSVSVAGADWSPWPRVPAELTVHVLMKVWFLAGALWVLGCWRVVVRGLGIKC